MRRTNIILSFCLLTLLLTWQLADSGTLRYQDKLGRNVTIQTPVKRAVLYETYELMPVMGAWDRVAGLGRYAFEDDLIQAINPGLSRTIPSVGSAMDCNAEELLRLKPDVVVTWTVNPQAIRFLVQKGLPVIAVYPESIPELYDVMRMEGRLFGREKQMEGAIAKMEEIFTLIRFRTAGIPAVRRKKALYLTGKPTKVNGRIGVTQDLFTMMGLDNGGREINGRSAEVSPERIISWNPDLIFIWGSARYSAADLLNNPQWRHIKAIRSHNVHKEPRWGTWSPRLAPIALWMAATAYPERFRDIDLTKTIDKFYRDVYGIPYAKVTKIER